MTLQRLFIGAMTVALFSMPLASRADTSMGTLVYHFTYGADQRVTDRNNNNYVQGVVGGSSTACCNNGLSNYSGALADKGTMTVQVVKQQPDGGLIVNISEQGETTRRAPPATCVVYGNTNVICDPNKTVYTEEYTLLRFMGANFVDPNALDANKHWTITQIGGGDAVKATYAINSNNNGLMQISEVRSVREAGGGSLTTDIQSKIGYDFKRSLPMSVDEYVTQRHDNGVSGTSTTIYQTTLNLVSDSMAKT